MEFVKIVHAVFSKRISKVLFCLLCFLGIGMEAYSQDVIVKKDGEEKYFLLLYILLNGG